ncbi:unnamed protein product [Mycena citricolor]|uniref:T6SS Phospholipase effector Tle1-like catalytic domain-containing protein n=1 Tax=Mycena citricolor TaxID=2018698 RepID=A0AAD2HQB7_9AGAR|nr:unnamed protein product [Mycena citricolor]
MSLSSKPNSKIQYSTETEVISRVKKRIVVCCDGTWQDGVSTANRQAYTNILRLARTVNHEDTRFDPPIPQIVFYQSGIGSDKGFYSEYVVGVTGSTLADKVEEAYSFIAHNYFPGDEIFLFGFSRGAYTARMVAMFINSIGVLNRTDMDYFAEIFLTYQKLGKSGDHEETHALREKLATWTSHTSPGKVRAVSAETKFSVKFLGVFDTVGSLGMPEEISHRSEHVRNIFGFNDRVLGDHVQYAYQALALNENREDFDCCKFEQSAAGLAKGQTLQQCWFTGSHADIGGGYTQHDLSDLTLFWMASNLEKHLSLDYKYLGSLPHPSAPWGALPAHNTDVGVFALAKTIQRKLPTETDNITHEMIHASVIQQKTLTSAISADLAAHPELIAPLAPLEDALRHNWSLLPPAERDPSIPLGTTAKEVATTTDTGLTTESGQRVRERNWLGRVASSVKDALSSLDE